MDGQEKEMFERITAVESSLKSLHKRVDHIEELVESVQKMTVELQHMREDINKVAEKVDEIEKKPARNWQAIMTGLISAVVGGAGTLIVEKLIGG